MTARPRTGNGKPVLAIAGPTCSGKSALALALAERLGGTIVNADSMQVYRELRIVTARPTPEDEAAIPHRLYGIRPAAESGSVAWWCEQATAAIAEAHEAGRLPILCGGTGLYFAALKQGLANIPDPGEAARLEARTLLADGGPEALHRRLAEHDPRTASSLRPTDSQRIARAWEVLSGTGRGLSAWQTDQAPPPEHDWHWQAIVLDPPRATLRHAIATRFAAMIEAGAVAEIRDLLAQNLSPALPAMRAHGVPELSAMLRGEITLAEAQRLACIATGQYTKRQATWFRHRHIAAESQTHRLNAETIDQKTLSQINNATQTNIMTAPD